MERFGESYSFASHAGGDDARHDGTDSEQSTAWRRLPADSGSSSAHILQADALSRLVNLPTIWWHWTEEPTLILGAGQFRADVDLDECDAAGVRVTKRHSGGTSVYADPSLLGLDVALPPKHPLVLSDVVESYRWIGEAWVDTLSLLGVTGQLVAVETARTQSRPSTAVESILRMACFGSVSPYEVVVEGRKLVGLSQVRRTGRVLLQCGVYLQFQAATLVQLLPVSDRNSAIHELDAAAIGLDEAAGREIPRGEVMAAFTRTLNARLQVVERDGTWTAEELAYIERA